MSDDEFLDIESVQGQAALLDQLNEVDPEIATALREAADSTHVPTAPDGDPLGYYQPYSDNISQDDW